MALSLAADYDLARMALSLAADYGLAASYDSPPMVPIVTYFTLIGSD
jgi:hypothetical protein